ncbi:predicted protein [Streptomyces filamentosus NRRL 15998]|uniref:Predicted protein n=1 Tax=Streptomyces filamentosus NRRL 15998 TaxID=457431 RepID=D6ALG9_STRFL|nr:predicted protein [Streptomyces filamentosus NRRL 15998]
MAPDAPAPAGASAYSSGPVAHVTPARCQVQRGCAVLTTEAPRKHREIRREEFLP